MSNNDIQKPRWLPAALKLATGSTQREAAEASGVEPITITRWLRKAGFRQRISQLQSDIVKEALGKLVASTTSAAETLARLLGSKDERVSLEAARSVLTHFLKVREQTEMTERIDELEQLESRQQGPSWFEQQIAETNAERMAELAEWVKKGRPPAEEPAFIKDLPKRYPD
jgi:transcriptional regulator with XRE-family HTH domain